jgi:hypothetical protein
MYTAVIVEPRKHKALKLVLHNFNKNLDENWEFIIYHGNLNKSFIEEILINTEFLSRKIKLISLNLDNLNINEYNKLFFSEFYYKNINSEFFLVFQTDTLLSDIYSKNIYNFIKYDYVGAPWNNNLVGNGGFSLRKKSKMLELINEGGFIKENNEYHYEDRFFSKTINLDKIYNNLFKPDFNIAKEFSVENVFCENSIGLHKPWNHLKNEEIEILKTHFFDLEELINLHKK